MAQDARQVDIGYEITFAGLTGFRIDVTARFDGQSYDVESHTFKEGMLRAVTIHYDGRNRAWGGFSPQGARPSAGSLSIVVGDKPRTWIAQYGAGGCGAGAAQSGMEAAAAARDPRVDRRGSLDPLSAALTVGLAGDAACDRTVPSNDGKRRIDVDPQEGRHRACRHGGRAGRQGDLLICEIYTRRVSGEFHDAPKEAETERERPMRMWLARFDQTPGPLSRQARGPDRLRHDPRQALWFRERPLTPAGERGDAALAYAARLWPLWRRMARISAAAAGMLVPGP